MRKEKRWGMFNRRRFEVFCFVLFCFFLFFFFLFLIFSSFFFYSLDMFDHLDKDKNGKLTLEDVLSVTSLPGVDFPIPFIASPIFLYRFSFSFSFSFFVLCSLFFVVCCLLFVVCSLFFSFLFFFFFLSFFLFSSFFSTFPSFPLPLLKKKKNPKKDLMNLKMVQ